MATSIVASMIIDRARTGTRGWDLPRSFRRSPQVCAQDSSVFGKDARAGKAEQADGVRPPGPDFDRQISPYTNLIRVRPH